MSGFEYRVVWQREGMSKRRKTFGRQDTAERYVKRLRGELPILPELGDDPDAHTCCDGYECGCRGETVDHARQRERERLSVIPSLTFGPVIEARPVGEWSASS